MGPRHGFGNAKKGVVQDPHRQGNNVDVDVDVDVDAFLRPTTVYVYDHDHVGRVTST